MTNWARKRYKRRVGSALAVSAALALIVSSLIRAAEPVADRANGAWRLACRLASYGKYQDAAWDHLPKIGVHHIFINVPLPKDVAGVKKQLERCHLKPLVMRGQTDLGRPDCVEELAVQLATCGAMGVRYMFLSPQHTGVDKETACARLRQAGDIARRHGVVLALETHPDMGTNGDVHRETMKRINHPNVRVNFDTGNITYYNKDADVVAELKKIIDYVATVELKDHRGRPMSWEFPALGRGKIDFAGVLTVLKEHGYSGPVTIEVEGIRGEPWDEAQTKAAIADSVAYLRKLAPFQ
jgi:sugar phosphate isomerase/epimerase